MGMNPADFWPMSWRDFRLKQQGFFEMVNAQYRTQWEAARFVAFYCVQPWAKKGRLNRVTDLVRFEWERQDVEIPSKEEIRYWTLKYGKHTDENGNGYNA